MAIKPKEGDIIEIPLSNGKKAYCWYLYNSQMGPLVQVFSLISGRDETMDHVLQLSKPLFPPVLTNLSAAINEHKWKIIGYKPVTNFVHPRFISTLTGHRTGNAYDWYLWDGEKEIIVGPNLPTEYKQLEFLMVWDPISVVNRIERGKVPFPYTEMTRHTGSAMFE